MVVRRFLISALAVSALAGTAAAGSAADAATFIITPAEPGVVSGSYTFTGAGSETFKFTIDAPYVFTFELDDGSIVSSGFSGAAGIYTDVVRATRAGTVSYTLTTSAVPETATWAMFIGGFGLMGAATRRRSVAVSFG
jgi:hypothetical protein